MAEMKDLAFATRMRDAVTAVAEGVINRMRPEDTFATVQSCNYPNQLAYVVYPGETIPVSVAMGSFIPRVNDRVRVAGSRSDRHVAEVMTSWVTDSLRNPILKTAGGNETRGNGTVIARYRVSDGECRWQGHYILGTTTAWPGGALSLILPMNPESSFFVSSASMPGESVRAYNGNFHFGTVEYMGGVNLGTVTIYTRTAPGTAASTQWTVNTIPFAWGNTNVLSWDLRYPIA